MTPVFGLTGYSYSGKSTVAEMVHTRLETDGIRSALIKKDDAIREVGYRETGELDTKHAYGVGSRQGREVNKIMNRNLREALPANDLVFLEGGTRTPAGAAITLAGLENDTRLHVITFRISPVELLKRCTKRRGETERADDALHIAAAKLIGQAWGNLNARNQLIENALYFDIDANQPAPAVADTVEAIVREQLQ